MLGHCYRLHLKVSRKNAEEVSRKNAKALLSAGHFFFLESLFCLGLNDVNLDDLSFEHSLEAALGIFSKPRIVSYSPLMDIPFFSSLRELIKTLG